MINNYICKDCDHSLVCELYKKKICIFDEDAKTQLGVDFTLDSCTNFRTIESKE